MQNLNKEYDENLNKEDDDENLNHLENNSYYEKIINPLKNIFPYGKDNNHTEYLLKLLEFIEKYSNINTSIFRNGLRTSNIENDTMEKEFNQLLVNLLPFLLNTNTNNNLHQNIALNIETISDIVSKIIYDNLPNKGFFENNHKMEYKINKSFSIKNFTENAFIIKKNKEYIIKIYKEVYDLDIRKFICNVEQLSQLFDDYKQIIDNNMKLIEIEIECEVNEWVTTFNISDKFDIEKYKKQIRSDISHKIIAKEENNIRNIVNCIFYEIHFMIENIS